MPELSDERIRELRDSECSGPAVVLMALEIERWHRIARGRLEWLLNELLDPLEVKP